MKTKIKSVTIEVGDIMSDIFASVVSGDADYLSSVLEAARSRPQQYVFAKELHAHVGVILDILIQYHNLDKKGKR